MLPLIASRIIRFNCKVSCYGQVMTVPITSDTTIVCTKLQEPSWRVPNGTTYECQNTCNILVSLGGNHSGACETSISVTQDTIFTLVDLVHRVPSDLGPAVNLCTKMIPTLNVAVWIHLTTETIKSFPTVAPSPSPSFDYSVRFEV
jgi:hypothetical protein